MRGAERRRRDEPRSSHEDPGQANSDDREQMSDEMPRDVRDHEQDEEQSELQDNDADDVVMAVSGGTQDSKRGKAKKSYNDGEVAMRRASKMYGA